MSKLRKIFQFIYKLRCRTTSYKKAPQATETFKELISPNRGKDALWSRMFSTEGEIPFSSDPIMIAKGWVRSKS